MVANVTGAIGAKGEVAMRGMRAIGAIRVISAIGFIGFFAGVSPVLGTQALQGAAGNIQATDSANLGLVGCRVWSLSDPGINNNFDGTCLNNRCLRPYNSNPVLQPGGYICQGEHTGPYNNDADLQTFYELIDGEASAGTCNHVAFYSLQGMIAQSQDSPAGDFRQQNCPGIAPTNCFERADSRFCGGNIPLVNTYATYGQNPHQITCIGGLNPVPVVRVAYQGTCPVGQARLTWEEPERFDGAMKNGVPSPVKGVVLYSNSSPCSSCPDGSTGWVPVSAFPLGSGAVGTCVPVAGDTWYALTVRVVGPLGGANEVETGRVGATGFVGANSQCLTTQETAIRVANLTARYTGRGNVSVSFATGLEGGLQEMFVLRGISPSGPFLRVSPPLSPQGDGSSYVFTDRVRPVLSREVFYSIEIVGTEGGSERSGSVSVQLPAARRKLGRD